jgi:crotonobetainyl-CoA hydratase
MLLTGRPMSAQEALRWGLVNAVVPAAEVLPRAREFARIIAAGAPLSVQATKEVLRKTEGLDEFQAIRATRERRLPIHARMLDSEDHLEGPRAFLERREPRWKGR